MLAHGPAWPPDRKTTSHLGHRHAAAHELAPFLCRRSFAHAPSGRIVMAIDGLGRRRIALIGRLQRHSHDRS
ncbi:MAG: hypothetical protein AAB363_08545, partial [Planctomycetota bacterium]